jgi:predicted dehydrogenase
MFLKRSAMFSAGAVVAPLIIPRNVLAAPGKPGANELVPLGVVGMGNRGKQIADNFPATGRIVAVADVELGVAEAAAKNRKADWKIYQDYREMLEKEAIAGVILCTCDHNHILPAVHACQASKDIYVEKPFSLYVMEGRALVRAVEQHGRICQTGSQARTIGTTRAALEMIRDGRLGRLQSIRGRNYIAVPRYAGGAMPSPLPPRFDWDLWCGQTELFPYSQKLHRSWNTFSNYCGGNVAGLGAHAYDMIQFALGADETGPVELWTTSEAGLSAKVRMKYANGFEVSLESDEKTSPFVGAIFSCENGKVETNEHLVRSNPKSLVDSLPPAETGEVGYRAGWMGKSHIGNWIDCIKTRKRPHAHEEIGHRSATVCHLVNITKLLGRRLHWDPAAERFVGDDEANRLLSRPRRKGYELPSMP